MRQPALFFAALALASSVAPLALADALDAPPAGYEETCTTAQRALSGTRCKTCEATADMPSACQTMFTMTEDEYVCQTWGTTRWTEVWCDGPTRDFSVIEGCALGGGGASSGSAALGAGCALLAAAALARRRGRR